MNSTQDSPGGAGHKSYQGVEGWLLVFCLMLVFYVPLRSLYSLFAYTFPAFGTGRDFKNQVQLIVYSAMVLGLAVFAFITGVRLWLVSMGALRLAKVWLLTFLCAHVAYFVFWLSLCRPLRAEKLAEMAWYHVVGPLGPFYLWNVYLEHSKRVRQTYFAE